MARGAKGSRIYQRPRCVRRAYPAIDAMYIQFTVIIAWKRLQNTQNGSRDEGVCPVHKTLSRVRERDKAMGMGEDAPQEDIKVGVAILL